ncbi:MAG TPA: FAD-binding protein, partial [Pseudonocardiaceae bacterium]|nr:FAD-binding protein [Pseudonocardiaceae bacterium]
MGGSNWAGNHKYAADRVLSPNSVDELRELVVNTVNVKPLGTRHSFNDIADFPGGTQIDVSGIDCPLEINENSSTVTVGAAVRYGDLA